MQGLLRNIKMVLPYESVHEVSRTGFGEGLMYAVSPQQAKRLFT